MTGKRAVVDFLCSVLKSLLLSMVLTAFFLLALSVVYLSTDLAEGLCRSLVTASALVSVFVAAFSGAHGRRKQGLFLGAASGAFYAAVLFSTGFLAFGFPGFHKSFLATLGLCLICGALGGIVGVNVGVARKK